MGLCKCPHRKITNIFCYEHRVTVCEYCVLEKHAKCVVDTYRKWLTDSVFSTKCELCDQELQNGETIRLLCFHLVHWDCLDSWARDLPPDTAPAGYKCPICQKLCVFPQPSQISPIADILRLKMGEVNWARTGLGLPLLDNDVLPRERQINGVIEPKDITVPDNIDPYFEPQVKFNQHTKVHQQQQSYANQNQSYTQQYTNAYTTAPVLNNYSPSPTNNVNQNHFYSESPARSEPYIPLHPRIKNLASDLGIETPLLIDEDEHKYRRRSPFESLSRWLRNSATIKSKRSRKRTILYIILGIVGVLLLLMYLFGRGEDDEADIFNPEANINVKVGNGIGFLGHQPQVIDTNNNEA